MSFSDAPHDFAMQAKWHVNMPVSFNIKDFCRLYNSRFKIFRQGAYITLIEEWRHYCERLAASLPAYQLSATDIS